MLLLSINVTAECLRGKIGRRAPSLEDELTANGSAIFISTEREATKVNCFCVQFLNRWVTGKKKVRSSHVLCCTEKKLRFLSSFYCSFNSRALQYKYVCACIGLRPCSKAIDWSFECLIGINDDVIVNSSWKVNNAHNFKFRSFCYYNLDTHRLIIIHSVIVSVSLRISSRAENMILTGWMN